MDGDSQAADRPVSKPVAERAAAGKAARRAVPRASHAGWDPPADRPDPMSVISAQETGRLPWLLPVRRARMAESPFSFYRGCAALMAADLSGTPTMGVPVQLCGDAHLANFGTFASPERRQVFDVNDFDETLPGPWEWDVKRLATSFVLAARDDGFDDPVGRPAAVRAVSAYRRAMASFATTSVLDVWYAQVSLDLLRAALPERDRKRFDRGQRQARQRTSQQVLAKLTEEIDGELRMRSDPPLLAPLRDLAANLDQGRLRTEVWDSYDSYLSSVGPDRRHVLSRFEPVDVALKVVGVGSVGTRCFIVLLRGLDHQEPLFLQVKEATTSVLEAHLAPSGYPHCGQRVVEGQRLMQAGSDIFLGWSKTSTGPHYYWRQFRDMKGSFDVAVMNPAQLNQYAEACGWTLAHCHARSGDAITIAGYLGSGPVFDEAVGDFAVAYADQTARDHAAFVAAVKQRDAEESVQGAR
jgi:uncharacterized protein (DUF2252 family)